MVPLSSFAASDGRYLGQVTSSFGVATFAHGIPNRGQLIREADEALYAAMSSGRNLVLHADLQVEASEEPTAEATGGVRSAEALVGVPPDAAASVGSIRPSRRPAPCRSTPSVTRS